MLRNRWSKLAQNGEEQHEAEETLRNWSEKTLTENYRELEAVRDAIGGAVDLLHGDFDQRFRRMLDIGQEFLLEWAKVNTTLQSSNLLWRMTNPASEIQIHCEQ